MPFYTNYYISCPHQWFASSGNLPLAKKVWQIVARMPQVWQIVAKMPQVWQCQTSGKADRDPLDHSCGHSSSETLDFLHLSMWTAHLSPKDRLRCLRTTHIHMWRYLRILYRILKIDLMKYYERPDLKSTFCLEGFENNKMVWIFIFSKFWSFDRFLMKITLE